MKTYTNELGGTTTSLRPGDNVNSLPAELVSNLAPELIDVFGNPIDWIAGIAQRTTRDSMKRLLCQFVDNNKWELVIVDPNFPMPILISGLRFLNKMGKPCFLHPQCDTKYEGLLPEIFDDFQWINWGGLGYAGQLNAENQWDYLSGFEFTCNHVSFDDESTRVFANSPSGDVMVCNEHKAAGYVSHEDGSAYEFGQLSDMIDWIFECLCDGHWPEFDWNRIPNVG